MKRRKKSPLQYLLKAWFFMIWTLLDFGCDKWCGSNIVLGPTKATIFFFIKYIFYREFDPMAFTSDDSSL